MQPNPTETNAITEAVAIHRVIHVAQKKKKKNVLKSHLHPKLIPRVNASPFHSR